MIAASEEFLHEIEPWLSFDGSLTADDMRISAVCASSRLLFDHGWTDKAFGALVVSASAAWRGLASLVASHADWERKYDIPLGIGTTILTDGMPFVGWSINADSRRISGPAQPGEGDFIKYLGRDL